MKTIFNIFSKKQQKIKEPQKIVVDYRERNSLVISELVSLGIEVEFQTLKVADYLVRDVAIERKTVSDFISSMLNRRLLNQLEELQQYENRLLIIEGIDEQELYTDSVGITGLHPNSVRGFLISILINYKVPIIYTKNYLDTAIFLSVLAKRKSGERPLNVKKRALNIKQQRQLIIEGFPGIGPKNAKKLLKEFKSIKNIINASEEDLKKVVGKKSIILRKIIDGEFS